LYNEYSDGGILMWFVRGHGVFVDGRVEAYPFAFLQRVRFADLSGNYQGLFKEYQVRCAVTRTGSSLARALKMEPAMSLRFSDDRWSVFGPIGETPTEGARRSVAYYTGASSTQTVQRTAHNVTRTP